MKSVASPLPLWEGAGSRAGQLPSNGPVTVRLGPFRLTRGPANLKLFKEILTTSTIWEDPLRMLPLIKNHDLSINSVLVLDLSIRFSDLYTCSINFLLNLCLSILSFSTSVN